MTLKKQVSISLTADEKTALDSLATSLGYPSTSGMIAAIANGQLTLGAPSTLHLQGQVDSLWNAIEGIHRQLAAAPPLTPVDLP